MNGILIIDKPGGITSHDVVQRVRKLLKTHRVGHLGTLDPMATGVLPLCIGKATRIGRFFAASPKEYIGEIRFGFSTATYDREGESTSSPQPFGNTIDEVATVMKRLTGSLDQTPPAVSAKKWGGIPSYKLARRGQVVENVPVRVEVSAFDLVEFRPPLIAFRVVCSAGTYVRSLAHDLGQQLGCGAHLESLRRLQSGEFRIEQAIPLLQATAEHVTPIERVLLDLSMIRVSGLEEDRVRHGNPIRSDAPAGLARIFNSKDEFVAVAVVERGWARPQVVLTSKAWIHGNEGG
jgi:tRNA pseudouridine55 synthase